MRARWLFHPESPGTRVLVVRGFFARLFLPKHFATADEVEAYRLYRDHLSTRQPGYRARYDEEAG